VLRKQPIAAWQDTDFACEAHQLSGTTFIAHVRYASTGKLDVLNTRPLRQYGRLFAHNGVVGGLDVLDARLAELVDRRSGVGQTDSERVFALVTASIRARGHDIGAGLVDASRWLADNVPIYAVNLLLCTATDMWALRYPEPNKMYVLGRREPLSCPHFDMQTPQIHARSDHLDLHPSVVFASEPMDDDPGWQLIDPGALVHVDDRLAVTRVGVATPA
jgi:predicted glutamine amidotransferase